MFRKAVLVLCFVLALCVLGGCTMMPASSLEKMFRSTSASTGATASTSGAGASGAAANSAADTVTIPRQQYEKYRELDDLITLMDSADQYFYQDVDHTAMLEGAAAGALKGLGDDYTFYYNPEEYKQMWEDDEGEYAGIGILITANYKTQLCTISRVFKGSPAEAAGVQRGDILYRVGEDLFVTADTLQDAVNIMRGTPGSPVDVTFIRNGEELTFTLNRAIINVNQIESTILDGEIGYIAFYQFAGHCENEFEDALNSLVAEGIRGLIIDLRDNPGGWVDAAQYVADLFLDQGYLCSLAGRDGVREMQYELKNGKVDIPLVILVNENTASSSEILTGALRDKAGATVVGVNTYGKGIVQVVLPVGSSGAGFQMTIAQYYTPNGHAVHKIGIAPDVEVHLEEGDNGSYDFADTANDPQLKKAVEVMREKIN